MCVGGQDIPVTLRVAGGIEGGKWKSEEDVRSTPQPEEEVQTTETAETEVMEPSAPLYKPVIERIDKLSERLPEKVAEETFEEVSPMMQEGFQMADRNQFNTMQMLHNIMRNTRPRRPWQPRGPRGDGPFGKGGGHMVHPGLAEISNPRKKGSLANPSREQLAGLAGLFGRPQQHAGIRGKGINPEQIMATPTQLPNFPKQQMATPMQPEVVEEQQQMEILGQPKQFAGGGIVNALMATPIGQAAIKQYAQGGEVEAQQIFEMAQTGASIEDILAGRARFFERPRYRHAEVISDISDTLGVGTPIKKKREEEQPQGDDAGGEPPSETDWGWAAASGPELFGLKDDQGKPVGPQSIPGNYKIGDTFIRGGETITDPKTGATIAPSGAGPHKGDKFSLSMFSIPGIVYSGMKEQDAKDAAVKEFNKNYVEPTPASFPPGRGPSFIEPSAGIPTTPTQKLLSETQAPADNKSKGKGEFSDPPSKFDAPPEAGKDNNPDAVKGLTSVFGMIDQGARGRSGYTPTNIANLYTDALYSPDKAMSYLTAGEDMLTSGKNVFSDYGDISQYGDKGGAGFAQTIADYQSAVAENNQGFTADADADYGFGETPGAGEDALGGIT